MGSVKSGVRGMGVGGIFKNGDSNELFRMECEGKGGEIYIGVKIEKV